MGFFVLAIGILLLVTAGGFGTVGPEGSRLDDFVAFSMGGGLLLAGGIAAMAHKWGVWVAWAGCGVALAAGLLRFFLLQNQLDKAPNGIGAAFALIIYCSLCMGLFLALSVDLRQILAEDS